MSVNEQRGSFDLPRRADLDEVATIGRVGRSHLGTRFETGSDRLTLSPPQMLG
jgi:hypothetical protein